MPSKSKQAPTFADVFGAVLTVTHKQSSDSNGTDGKQSDAPKRPNAVTPREALHAVKTVTVCAATGQDIPADMLATLQQRAVDFAAWDVPASPMLAAKTMRASRFVYRDPTTGDVFGLSGADLAAQYRTVLANVTRI
jgi:hypothetical protein